MNKVATMTLQGNEYAKVAERLKAFREACPNGLIETTPNILDDGQIMFSARVLKDKANPQSGEATGHALGKNTGAKAFEKLETIAVGRALALLGYLASGEIASGEEMEEFLAHKEEQHQNAVLLAKEQLEEAKTLDELKEVFVSLGTLIGDPEVVAVKDRRKAELTKGDIEFAYRGPAVKVPDDYVDTRPGKGSK